LTGPAKFQARRSSEAGSRRPEVCFALAPGAIMTPLLGKQLASPREAKAIHAFPVPVAGFGDAGQLADWMLFTLSDAADFLRGSVVFVDGGSDAYLRSEDWPHRVPTLGLPRYLYRFARHRRTRRSGS
jgi:hypothetical protein